MLTGLSMVKFQVQSASMDLLVASLVHCRLKIHTIVRIR